MTTAVLSPPVDAGPTLLTLAVEAIGGEKTGSRVLEPVTAGVPLARGYCRDPSLLTLSDSAGRRRPLQARALDLWPDGTIRWVLLDFQAHVDSGGAPQYLVSAQSEPGSPHAGITLSTAGTTTIIDTDVARFYACPGGRFPFDQVTVGGLPAIDATRSNLEIESADGAALGVEMTRVLVEERGSLRAVLLYEGVARTARGAHALDLHARVHFFAGSPTVRVSFTVRNPRKAAHPGGLWPLGARGSVYLRDLSLRLALPPLTGRSSIRCAPEAEAPYEEYDAPFELYQDSSGGENWRSANHVNRDGIVPARFRGYRVRGGPLERSGLRATPILTLTRGDRRLGLAMPEFWQNFPKAIEASEDSLVIRLFPRQSSDVHEIQGGEQKTHTWYLSFGNDAVTGIPLDWGRAPVRASAAPAWYCATGAVRYLTPAAEDQNKDYLRLVDQAISGETAFERKREKIDEYGWRSYGDVYADHEAVGHRGTSPLVSHYNNQYDIIAGCGYQFLRSGDCRWRVQMDALAAHVADIDIYHTSEDKAAYNGGLFWHTFHYVDVGTATHRSYPPDRLVDGGGPSAEQNYTNGFALHYFLTGDEASRDAVLTLARWVVDMDDGRHTVFRWLDRGPTGLATATGSPLYHGPGRAGANSIVALMNAYRLSGDVRFLEKAEELIRRVIHPRDDIARLNLLDAERRWYYTVFLQVLGSYLDDKAERGSLDRMYAYARESLLHYAHWMAAHEYPYLEKPEILEYPNETWAAQDMRKSEVFKFAAKHASPSARARFLERSRYFFEYSTKTLTGLPTRGLARPVALMLSYGFMHAYFQRHPDIAAPTPGAFDDFGAPAGFVPQKVRAIQRATRLGAMAAAGSLAGLGYLILSAM